jgi:hypothetical protein
VSIKVIGAGFGRTGTLSLKNALERLGFAPCYHMLEVYARPQHIDAWYRTSRDGRVDWSVFDDFQATVDWPAVHYWRELVERYADAKVVLSTRDPESWYESVSRTIYGRLTTPVPVEAPEERHRHRAMARKIVLEETFGGRFEDRIHALAVFQRHNEAVRATVDPSRLLVFNVKEGWVPLCRFLDVPIPDEPFPRINDTASFLEWASDVDQDVSQKADERQ